MFYLSSIIFVNRILNQFQILLLFTLNMLRQ